MRRWKRMLFDKYYFQCLPGATTAATTKTTTTAVKTTTAVTTTKTTTAATTTIAASGNARTAPPSGALVVRQSGTKSGEYASINAAVAALGTGTTAKTIFIYQGTFTEHVIVNYTGPLTIQGYTTDYTSYAGNTVVLTNNIPQSVAQADGSATLLIQKAAANVKVYNLNIKNTYGVGSQAIAMSASGVYGGFYGCGFYGYQDTLYAKQGKQYYANCFIQGAVDYIYGSASAWFNKCILSSNANGAITANGRESTTDPSWYVFESCTIQKASAVQSGATLSTGGVYLGRPWQVDARVLYQRCVIPDLVNAAGWEPMAAGATPFFYEYQNTGAGASTSKRQYLTSTTVSQTKAGLFASDTGFIDAAYPS
ncbi:hypothetical protein TWF694_010202 [Orbilia ellipsospora]|uniref:pectinesterase n=1 Tax=Orbilia ellipsospora TaxID=2528407 RepID=A0AAV9XA44_9PEZI